MFASPRTFFVREPQTGLATHSPDEALFTDTSAMAPDAVATPPVEPRLTQLPLAETFWGVVHCVMAAGCGKPAAQAGGDGGRGGGEGGGAWERTVLEVTVHGEATYGRLLFAAVQLATGHVAVALHTPV